MGRHVLWAGIFMDSANAMNGISYCIQKGGAATGHVVFLGHGTHAFQG